MWEFLSSLVSLIIGATNPTLPGGIPMTSEYVNQVSGGACYSPDPTTTLTLDANNLKNVTNPRKTLNPKLWAKDPIQPVFDTDKNCLDPVIGNNYPGTKRTFILVRKNVRISSCKTDELAGPYGKGVCPGWNNNAPELSHRGSCDNANYTDLRKIADVSKDGRLLEVFWNPYSYNVGCHDPYKFCTTGNECNCGPGDNRDYMNLKDFIYVLNKRDAFTSADNPNCPALWDAGSSNEKACSHYFDVYLAADVYNQIQQVTTIPTDKHDPMYFYKQVMENCQENTTFMPAPNESSLEVPPIYISSPFVSETNLNGSNLNTIIPQSTSEQKAYMLYIWNRASTFFPNGVSTHLIKQQTKKEALNICTRILSRVQAVGTPPPTPTPDTGVIPTIEVPLDCYDKVGAATFKDANDNDQVFNVYLKGLAPQTFVMTQVGSDTVYYYSITDVKYPNYKERNSSLQLGNMELITENHWTWATPWCKPAIYLYPQKETTMNVKLNLTGSLTKSIPDYGSNGWDVIAQPNGKLSTINHQPITNNYLYYEADIKDVTLPKEGWVMAAKDIPDHIGTILTQIGFNQTEISDFMNYWLPRLTDKPYYFVTLLPETMINEKETILISNLQPTTNNLQPIIPDTMIRARVAFEGLETPIRVTAPAIPSHARNGFTLTDWGGTIVGKSCTDITVK